MFVPLDNETTSCSSFFTRVLYAQHPAHSLRLNTTDPGNQQNFNNAPVNPKTGQLVPIYNNNGTRSECGVGTPYVCEHRFVPTTAMVQFHNAAGNASAQVNVRMNFSLFAFEYSTHLCLHRCSPMALRSRWCAQARPTSSKTCLARARWSTLRSTPRCQPAPIPMHGTTAAPRCRLTAAVVQWSMYPCSKPWRSLLATCAQTRPLYRFDEHQVLMTKDTC